MNKTYDELCDELALASERLADAEARLEEAESKAWRELVNMIEWPPARHQADQARQRLEFDRQCRRAEGAASPIAPGPGASSSACDDQFSAPPVTP